MNLLLRSLSWWPFCSTWFNAQQHSDRSTTASHPSHYALCSTHLTYPKTLSESRNVISICTGPVCTSRYRPHGTCWFPARECLLLIAFSLNMCSRSLEGNSNKAMAYEPGESRQPPSVAKNYQYTENFDPTDELWKVHMWAQPHPCWENSKSKKIEPGSEGTRPSAPSGLFPIILNAILLKWQTHAARVLLMCYRLRGCSHSGVSARWTIHVYPWSCPSGFPPHLSCTLDTYAPGL